MQYIIGYSLLALCIVFLFFAPTSIVTSVFFAIAGWHVGEHCQQAGKYLAERFFN